MLGRYWRSGIIIVGIVVFALLLAPNLPNSFAHPITIRSTPQAFQSVAKPPSEVDVYFSEPIELKYSKISVIGPDGSTVDRKDPHNVNGDTSSLAVSLPPGLPDGTYTVSTKVLSAADGHVVDDAFTFGVGASAKAGHPLVQQTQDLISLPEALSRYPGIVGQVMVVGAAFASLWLWRPFGRVPWLSNAIAEKRIVIGKTMVKFVLIGTILVLASGAAMIIVQANSVGASIAGAIATKFGNIWVTRMLQAAILLAIVGTVYRKVLRNNSGPAMSEIIAILILGMAILVTSGLIAHAAATGQEAAIALDFFHDLAAAIWIGGLMLLGFVVAPKILEMKDDKVKATAISLLIPRFSIIVVTILGIVAITGPLLLYSIENDLSVTIASIYGKFLIAKLSLAGVMLAMGGYSQFAIQKKAVSVAHSSSGGDGTSMIQTKAPNLKHFGKFLKAEAAVGIALLLMVSFMANSSVPSGQFPAYETQKQQQLTGASNNSGQASTTTAVPTPFIDTAFANGGQVKLTVNPFVLGQNNFQISFIGTDGKPVSNVESATIKMTESDKGIGPLTVNTTKQSDGVFAANAAFGVAGTWNAIIEGVRSQGSNMIATFDLTVKPAVANLEFSTKEYKTPTQSLPLYPIFDQQRQSIWVGDSLPGTGRIWQFNIGTGNYTMHNLKGVNIITQSVLAPDGSIWFIDPLGSNSTGKGTLGNYNPDNNSTKLFEIPEDGVPSGIALDNNGNLWMPVVQANKVVKFDVSNQKFSSFNIPTSGAAPVGIAADNQGNVWVAETAVGKIGKVNATSGNITEYAPTGKNQTLDEPSVIFPDPKSSNIYISEHEGHRITVFSPLFGTFREYSSIDQSGLPFGMAIDGYGNLWYAEHTIDKIAVLDPRTGQGTEAKIPITGSFIQYITSDDTGRIWFAAQRGSSLGLVTTTAKPSTTAPPLSAGSASGQQQQQQSANGTSTSNGVPQLGFSFADAAGPGIAIGIVLAAIAYTKSYKDLKRNLRLAQRLGDT